MRVDGFHKQLGQFMTHWYGADIKYVEKVDTREGLEPIEREGNGFHVVNRNLAMQDFLVLW